MSKMDGLRAMREAKYAQAAKRAGQPAAPSARREPRVPDRADAPRPTASPEPATAAVQLCGHRNMSGRSCTREHGHAAKSHRYS